MSSVHSQFSISLDGFMAGPNRSVQNPLGEGGMRLHQWALATDGWREQHGTRGGERNADAEVVEEVVENVGAYIMGRKMFGGGDGPWDESWRGWWGEDPPYHTPVFVLTHHEREPLQMQGDVVPVILGAAERPLEGVGDPKLEPVEVVASPAVTHIEYRVVRDG